MYIKLERSNIKKLLCYSDHCVLPGNCSGAFSFGSMPFVSLVFDYGSYGRFLLFLFGIRKLLEKSQLLFCLLLLLLSRILIVWKLPFYIQCFSIHWCFFSLFMLWSLLPTGTRSPTPTLIYFIIKRPPSCIASVAQWLYVFSPCLSKNVAYSIYLCTLFARDGQNNQKFTSWIFEMTIPYVTVYIQKQQAMSFLWLKFVLQHILQPL